jgi:predicted kinase
VYNIAHKQCRPRTNSAGHAQTVRATLTGVGAAVVLDSTIARLVSRTIAARTIGAAVVLDSTIARLVSRTIAARTIGCACNIAHNSAGQANGFTGTLT